jgi:arsenate reductase (thioredoxin)
VMRDLGLDVAGRTPRRLEHADLEWADHVVTMGCGDECPVVPGKRYQDWELPDPAGRPLEEVRAVRDEIARRIHSLVSELDAAGESLVSARQERRA